MAKNGKSPHSSGQHELDLPASCYGGSEDMRILAASIGRLVDLTLAEIRASRILIVVCLVFMLVCGALSAVTLVVVESRLRVTPNDVRAELREAREQLREVQREQEELRRERDPEL